jgi:hypothetical protein
MACRDEGLADVILLFEPMSRTAILMPNAFSSFPPFRPLQLRPLLPIFTQWRKVAITFYSLLTPPMEENRRKKRLIT